MLCEPPPRRHARPPTWPATATAAGARPRSPLRLASRDGRDKFLTGLQSARPGGSGAARVPGPGGGRGGERMGRVFVSCAREGYVR